jgi:MoxR-like ATPase
MTITATTTKLHPVAASLLKIQSELGTFFKERKSCIQAVTLALLTGEHVVMIGPPGTGKSMLIRYYFKRFDGAVYFEQLLSKNLPTEAVLGPYDIPALRDKGTFGRKYDGYLPSADLSMCDEIGKMSATLGHNLLAMMNERILHQVDDSGRSTLDVPLSTLASGTNELLTTADDDQSAAWDRLLIRVPVDYIQEAGNAAAMLTGPKKPKPGTNILWDDMKDVIHNVIPDIALPHDVIEVVLTLKAALRLKEITVSDRRWSQSMKVLQASAFMAGRDEVTVDDIEALRFTLWDTPSQITEVARLTLGVSNPIAEKAMVILEQAEEITKTIRDSSALSTDTKGHLSTELSGKLNTLVGNINRLRQDAHAAGASVTKIDEVGARLQNIKAAIYTDLLGMDLPSLTP